MMPFHRPYLAARILMSMVIVGILFGVFILIGLFNERSERIDSLRKQQVQLNEQQQRIFATQRGLNIEQRKLVDLSNRIKLTSCTDENARIKRSIVTEFVKDANLMEKLLPRPRTGEEELVANIFISEGVRAVSRANPLHDCSASSLKLLPLPSIVNPLTQNTTTTLK